MRYLDWKYTALKLIDSGKLLIRVPCIDVSFQGNERKRDTGMRFRILSYGRNCNLALYII